LFNLFHSNAFGRKCLSPFGDDYEEANDVQLDVFPLNDIGKDCFEQIIKWMEEHDEKPDPVIRDDPGTGEVCV
jgi:hypothetical protein